jgi:hypothetical protein
MFVQRPRPSALQSSSLREYTASDLIDFRRAPAVDILSKDSFALSEVHDQVKLINKLVQDDSSRQKLGFHSLELNANAENQMTVIVHPNDDIKAGYPFKVKLQEPVPASTHPQLAKIFAEAEVGHTYGRHIRADLRAEHELAVAERTKSMPSHYAKLTVPMLLPLPSMKAAASLLLQNIQRQHTAVLASKWDVNGRDMYSVATAPLEPVSKPASRRTSATKMSVAEPAPQSIVLAQPKAIKLQAPKPQVLGLSTPQHSVSRSPQNQLIALFHALETSAPSPVQHHVVLPASLHDLEQSYALRADHAKELRHTGHTPVIHASA